MSRFRLALINPNTNEQQTTEMVAAASAVLPDGAEVNALTAPRGPSSIETAAEEVIAAAEVLELVRGHRDVDAYLIACFSDPAVEAARELTDAPVVGIGEAAYRAVLMLARRFAVITTLPRGVPDIENGMVSLGVRHECVGVLSLGIPVAEQGAEFGDTNEAIVAAGQHAVQNARGRGAGIGLRRHGAGRGHRARTRRRTCDERGCLRRPARARALASEPADEPGRVTGAARAGGARRRLAPLGTPG